MFAVVRSSSLANSWIHFCTFGSELFLAFCVIYLGGTIALEKCSAHPTIKFPS
jgi:hypothetical protein